MTDYSKIIEVLGQLITDTSVPKNVRSSISRAKESLSKQVDDDPAALSTAIYALDDVSNDINLPMHARTMIWSILSELEARK